eukprot:GHRR01002315.1.p1 GENE.GHRR01002315.1~~GHRR01002315.1.p1  ORF type:complete len:224 (+),score=69.14 GHRR01002315.1:345-1016(+)
MRGTTVCVVALLSLLQIGTAVAVIAITAIQLANVQTFQGFMDQNVCLASGDPSNISVCTYIYAVGGVSIALTIVIGLLQLITCNMCGCGEVMDAVFTIIATGWWLVAGFITARHAKAANDQHVKGQDWRNAVVLLCWITAGLFGLLFATHMMRIGASCCRKRRKDADVDLERPIRPDRPPSAAVELGKEISQRPYMMGRWGGKKQQQQQAAPATSQYLSGPNI